MRTPIQKLLTLGEIALRLKQPPYRVEYLLRTRQKIAPVALAGNARLFDDSALEEIRAELQAIDEANGRRANR